MHRASPQQRLSKSGAITHSSGRQHWHGCGESGVSQATGMGRLIGQMPGSVPSHCSLAWFTLLSPQNAPPGLVVVLVVVTAVVVLVVDGAPTEGTHSWRLPECCCTSSVPEPPSWSDRSTVTLVSRGQRML